MKALIEEPNQTSPGDNHRKQKHSAGDHEHTTAVPRTKVTAHEQKQNKKIKIIKDSKS